MKSSRRDLLNDMAEHIAILKNSQNTYHPFWFHTQNRYGIPKNGGFVFTVYVLWATQRKIIFEKGPFPTNCCCGLFTGFQKVVKYQPAEVIPTSRARVSVQADQIFSQGVHLILEQSRKISVAFCFA